MFLQNTPIDKILYCSKIYTKPAKNLTNSGRPSHALVFFIEGHCDYIYDGKVYLTSPQSLLFLPKNKAYTINRHEHAQCIYIDFLTCEDVDLDPFVKSYTHSSQFRDIFFSLLSLYKQKRIGYEAEMMGLLYKLISMIQVADITVYLPNIKYQKISDAVEYINKNFASGQIKIPDLAKMSGVSTRYFSELFSGFFGVSPKEYILRMQLESAKSLLISSNESINSISDICGFSDVYYFSKMFKKATDKTPSEFRKANSVL